MNASLLISLLCCSVVLAGGAKNGMSFADYMKPKANGGASNYMKMKTKGGDADSMSGSGDLGSAQSDDDDSQSYSGASSNHTGIYRPSHMNSTAYDNDDDSDSDDYEDIVKHIDASAYGNQKDYVMACVNATMTCRGNCTWATKYVEHNIAKYKQSACVDRRCTKSEISDCVVNAIHEVRYKYRGGHGLHQHGATDSYIRDYHSVQQQPAINYQDDNSSDEDTDCSPDQDDFRNHVDQVTVQYIQQNPTQTYSEVQRYVQNQIAPMVKDCAPCKDWAQRNLYRHVKHVHIDFVETFHQQSTSRFIDNYKKIDITKLENCPIDNDDKVIEVIRHMIQWYIAMNPNNTNSTDYEQKCQLDIVKRMGNRVPIEHILRVFKDQFARQIRVFKYHEIIGMADHAKVLQKTVADMKNMKLEDIQKFNTDTDAEIRDYVRKLIQFHYSQKNKAVTESECRAFVAQKFMEKLGSNRNFHDDKWQNCFRSEYEMETKRFWGIKMMQNPANATMGMPWSNANKTIITMPGPSNINTMFMPPKNSTSLPVPMPTSKPMTNSTVSTSMMPSMTKPMTSMTSMTSPMASMTSMASPMASMTSMATPMASMTTMPAYNASMVPRGPKPLY